MIIIITAIRKSSWHEISVSCFSHTLHRVYRHLTQGLILLYSGCTHTLLWVLFTLYSGFTHTLLQVSSNITLSLFTLDSRFTDTFLWVFWSYSGFTQTLHCLFSLFYSHLTLGSLTISSITTHILLWVYSDLTLILLTLYCRCTHILLQVYTQFTPSFFGTLFWVYTQFTQDTRKRYFGFTLSFLQVYSYS